MHTVRIDNVPKQSTELLYTYHLYNGEIELGPDSKHVPLSYFTLLAGAFTR